MQLIRCTRITDSLRSLAVVARQEGHKNIHRLVDDFEAGTNRFDGAGEILYLVFLKGKLAGVGGLNRDPYSNAAMGRVRRIFVDPRYRNHGIASALLTAIESHAVSNFSDLNLFTTSEQASNFYLRRGFEIRHGIPKISHTKAL